MTLTTEAFLATAETDALISLHRFGRIEPLMTGSAGLATRKVEGATGRRSAMQLQLTLYFIITN